MSSLEWPFSSYREWKVLFYRLRQSLPRQPSAYDGSSTKVLQKKNGQFSSSPSLLRFFVWRDTYYYRGKIDSSSSNESLVYSPLTYTWPSNKWCASWNDSLIIVNCTSSFCSSRSNVPYLGDTFITVILPTRLSRWKLYLIRFRWKIVSDD